MAGGGAQCVAKCAPDEERKDGVCRKKNPCPEGQHEEGGACVPDQCGKDEIRVNGQCVPEKCLTAKTKSTANAPANANAKKVQNNGLRALVPLFPPFVMMAV